MENNTLDQIDGNYTLENYMEKGARLDKFVVIKNVVGEAQYVWKDSWRASESCIKRSANTTPQLAIPNDGTIVSDRSAYQTMSATEGSFCYKCERTK